MILVVNYQISILFINYNHIHFQVSKIENFNPPDIITSATRRKKNSSKLPKIAVASVSCIGFAFACYYGRGSLQNVFNRLLSDPVSS